MNDNPASSFKITLRIKHRQIFAKFPKCMIAGVVDQLKKTNLMKSNASTFNIIKRNSDQEFFSLIFYYFVFTCTWSSMDQIVSEIKDYY